MTRERTVAGHWLPLRVILAVTAVSATTALVFPGAAGAAPGPPAPAAAGLAAVDPEDPIEEPPIGEEPPVDEPPIGEEPPVDEPPVTEPVMPTSEWEKADALTHVEVLPEANLIALNDRQFVFAIWERSDAWPQVKQTALAAYKACEKPADLGICSLFIRTGIAEAAERDRADRVLDAVKREARRQAAAWINLVATPAMLAMSDRDFVLHVQLHAAGPRVKEAAVATLQTNTEQAYTAFIGGGILEAHKKDQQDAIDADIARSEAEKLQQAARDARGRAAAIVPFAPVPAELNLSDDNFIRRIIDEIETKHPGKVGTKVHAAAWAALRSPDPAVWKTYLDTGIYAANREDIEAALKKKAEEDRRLAREIKAKAENSLVHPALAAAATTALAGSDADVDRFLREGQYTALSQSVRTTTPGRKGWWVQGGPGNAGVVSPDPGTAGSVAVVNATWRIVPGLADIACHSLESVAHPGYYLRPRDNRVLLLANDGSADFKTAATWCASKGLTGSGVSFASKLLPGRYLRHVDGQLWAANKSFDKPADRSCLFNENATWAVDAPDPKATQKPAAATDACFYDSIAEKLKALGGVAALGKSTSKETAAPDKVGKFQHFEKASIYWSPTTHAWAVRGAVRTKWNGLKAEAGVLGYPVSDELTTADKRARYSRFQKGSIYWTSADGAKEVHGTIHSRFKELGYETRLGLPTTDETVAPDKVGKFSHFERGSIYYSKASGAWAVFGAIRTQWNAKQAEAGPLGYPITNELTTADGRARYSRFQKGVIFWTSAGGAQAVQGTIHSKYKALGYEKSVLGLPTSDEINAPDGRGRYNKFEKGAIYWTSALGAHPLFGCVHTKWLAAGAEKSTFGYPTTDTTAGVDTAGKPTLTAKFERGTITCPAA